MIDENISKPWDRKLANGLNVTEQKLYNRMLNAGLDPKPQYKISLMTVDFAFPNEKLAIEVNGNQHYTGDGKLVKSDRKRWVHLNALGWQVKTFRAETVYSKTDNVVYVITQELKKQQLKAYETQTSIGLVKCRSNQKHSDKKNKLPPLIGQSSYTASKNGGIKLILIGVCLLFVPVFGWIAGLILIIFGIIELTKNK